MKSNIRHSTAKKKLTIKTDWYRKTGKADRRSGWWGTKRTKSDTIGCVRDAPSAPLFIPRTDNGKLMRELKVIEEAMNRIGKYRVKIIEEGGLTLLSALSSKNPLGD